jgi:AAA+ superfamily predicted ATPase
MRIARALRQQNLEVENTSLRQQLDSKFGLENIIGESPAMKEVFEVVQQVAPTPVTVLLQGESGTGKELVARAIHQLSPRNRQPLVAVHAAGGLATERATRSPRLMLTELLADLSASARRRCRVSNERLVGIWQCRWWPPVCE